MPVWFAVYLALFWSQIAFSSAPESMACHYKFEVQPDYFVDYFEAARQCPGKKLTTRPNLGLIDKSYNDGKQSQLVSETSLPWERLAAHIKGLNTDSPDHVSYKVLFLMRHGLGVHNVFMEKVGGEAWRDYWSHLDGDGSVVFRDAKLVDQGIQQANILADFWAEAVSKLKVPLPETVYSSPLARCLETTRIVFSRLFEQLGQSLYPNIKELLRERLTDHTCDSRSSRTWIENNYPTFIIEPGFTENDELWKHDRSETPDEHVARKHTVLEDIFSNDPHQFVALTIHSYAMSAILRACGSEEFRIAEGSLVALVVRAEKIGASQLGTS